MISTLSVCEGGNARQNSVEYVNQNSHEVAAAVVGLMLLLILAVCLCFVLGIFHVTLPFLSTGFFYLQAFDS